MARFTDEQKQWIYDNVRAIEWKNQKHFTDVFNAIFGTDKSVANMNQWLYKHKLSIRSYRTVDHYTEDMKDWLKDNCGNYNRDFVKMARDFNKLFGTDYSNCRLAKYCERRLGIYKPMPKQRVQRVQRVRIEHAHTGNVLNRGTFKRGHTRTVQLPIGTIRYNSDGRPFIKVLMSNGETGQLSGRRGHNYKEPWWKPLQKKIWEDHYGEVPEGYVVCSLNGDPNDTDIRNIGIIDKRGTAIMAKKGWWTDNRVITGDGAQWCNLYYTAKDKGICVDC